MIKIINKTYYETDDFYELHIFCTTIHYRFITTGTKEEIDLYEKFIKKANDTEQIEDTIKYECLFYDGADIFADNIHNLEEMVNFNIEDIIVIVDAAQVIADYINFHLKIPECAKKYLDYTAIKNDLFCDYTEINGIYYLFVK